MSVLKTLRERVAPELNHLYTVPPSESAAGLDYGWRSREHALHTALVARMFGTAADLCTGDFAVLSRFVPPLTSIGRDERHAWCSVGGVAPVDLSLNFTHYGQIPQLRSVITGEGRNGDWEVQYAYDESPLEESVQERNEILFIEKEVCAAPAADLVANPYLFLPPAPADDTTGWAALHGPGIYAQITLHCFGCATGTAKSIRHRLGRPEAVAWIAANYPDAAARILEQLR